MSRPLRDPLEHLHTELYEANSQGAHETLSVLQEETQKTLAHPDPQAALAENPGYRARLEDTAKRFEASHPGVTRAARNLLEVLTANGL